MNVSDTEIAWAILQGAGFERTDNIEQVVLRHGLIVLSAFQP